MMLMERGRRDDEHAIRRTHIYDAGHRLAHVVLCRAIERFETPSPPSPKSPNFIHQEASALLPG
jgi:hypothetical protein